MKTHHLLSTLASTLLFAALPTPAPAADAAVDISSGNPHDATTILRQIDLNVAIKLYEKARMELEDCPVLQAEIESEMRRSPNGADEAKGKIGTLEMKNQVLQGQVKKFREQIRDLVTAAYKEQADVEALESAKLQGSWEGVEVGRENEGKCMLTVSGDTISFQGANKQEWYKTTFTLPGGTDPKQLRATITDCPAPDFIGKSALSIFKIEDGKLTLTGHAPGAKDMPKSFEGDPDARTFVFRKVEAR